MIARSFTGPVLLSSIMCLASVGCTATQLRNASVSQADTVHELHEQQVLNNVAMFFHDINAMPSFVWLGDGLAEIQNTGQGATQTVWQRVVATGIHGWASTNLSLTGTHLRRSNWALKPINDPRRLQLMRCAYQQVVRASLEQCQNGCPHTNPNGGGYCADCAKLFNAFYTGDSNVMVPPPGSSDDSGFVTNLCLGCDGNWIGWGGKKDVPKGHCQLVGHYCGTYVWVLPGGRDELSKLTLAILDYAVTTKVPLLKEVMFYIEADGTVTKRDDARTAPGTVKAAMPLEASVTDLPEVRATQINEALKTLQEDTLRETTIDINKFTLDSFLPGNLDEKKAKSVRKALDRRDALTAELRAIQNVPRTGSVRGPSLDELNLGYGNLRSLLYQVQQPQTPPQP